MSRPLTRFCFFAALLCAGFLYAQQPVIYSSSNISMVSPGVYQTYNCALNPTTLWTDSIYSAYSWSTGATTPSITLANPGQATTVSLTVTLSGNNYSSTATAAAVSGGGNQQNIFAFMGTEACVGDSIAIGCPFTGGFSTLVWSWGPTIVNNSDCDFYLSGSCYMYSHSSTQNKYVRITTEGCHVQSIPLTLNFFAIPTQPIITQSNDTLYASVVAARYVWYDGSMAVIPGATARWYKPTVAGTYYVCADGSFMMPVCLSNVSNGYSYSPGGCGASYTWTPDTTGQYSILVYNNSTPTPGNGGTYLWDFGDGNTSTLAYPQHQYAGPGSYNVCVTVSFGACSQTYCDTIVVVNKVNAPFTINVVDPNAVAVEPAKPEFNLQVGPNPSDGRIQVSFELPNTEVVGMRMMGIGGQEVWAANTQTYGAGSQTVWVDGSHCAPGIYFVELKLGERILRHRVVIQQ